MGHKKIAVKIFIIFFIFILIIAGLTVYLNQVYFPLKAKSLIVDGIENALGRKVSLRSVKLNILKGVILEDLTIAAESADKEPVFLKARQISIGWLILPLIKHRQIIVPFVNIYSPEVNIKRYSDNSFNIPLLKQEREVYDKDGGQAPKGFSFLVYKVNIKDARINFSDEAVTPNYRQRALLDVALSLSLPEKIKYSLSGKLENADKSPIVLEAKGDFVLKEARLRSVIKMENLNLESILAYSKGAPFAVKKGLIQKLDAELIAKDNLMRIEIAADAVGLNINKDGLGISGNVTVSAAGSYDIKAKVVSNYSGNLACEKINLAGLPYFKEASDVSGKFLFSTEKVEISALSVNTLGALFNFSGILSDFKNPRLNLKVAAESVFLEKIEALLSENNLIKFPVQAEGPVKLGLNLDMQLLQPETLQINGDAVLDNAKVSLTELKQEISAISGKLFFNNDVVEWKDIIFKFKDVKYNSSGRVLGPDYSDMDFKLVSDELTFNAAAKWKGSLLIIKQSNGKFLNSEFRVEGSAFFKKDAPELDITSNITLALEDLREIISDYFPEQLSVLDKIKAKGLCNIKLALKGRLNDIKALVLEVGAESEGPTLFIMGKQEIRFDNLRLNLSQKDRFISDCRLLAGIYSGKLVLTAHADLTSKDPLFNLNLAIANLDLTKLKEATALKDKSLSGILDANLVLGGSIIDATSFKGKGLITVKDGNLWEFAPFKKLGQFLFIPAFEKIIFNEAEADLIIEEGNIYSDEITLKSRQVNLYASGKMDFDGNLDYTVNSEFTAEITRDSSSLAQILSSVLGKASQFVTVKISGTITQPKPALVPAIFEPFEKLKKIFE